MNVAPTQILSHELWEACRRAKPLALGFNGTYPQPHLKIVAIADKLLHFQHVLRQFKDILVAENSSIPGADSLYQTLDECDDFLSDFQAVRRGRAAFAARAAAVPEVTYKLPRYFYTDTEIESLDKRLDLQLHTMNVNMDDIVLDRFVRVVAISKATPRNGNPKLPYSTDQKVVAPQWTNEAYTLQDSDDNIIPLYFYLVRLDNWLKRTTPGIQSSSDTPVRQPLSSRNIKRMRSLLQARLDRHVLRSHVQPSSLDQQAEVDMTDVDLQRRSKDKLMRVRSTHASLAVFPSRQRIYCGDEAPIEAAQPVLNLSKQARKENRSSSSVIVSLLGNDHDLSSLDVISYAGRRLIVSTAQRKAKGIVHYLPLTPDTYPFTYHPEGIVPPNHKNDVSLYERCRVDVSIDIANKIYQSSCHYESVIPCYRFSSPDDMLAFQSTLRRKLLRHALEVKKIKSKRGREATVQHLKIWSDFDGEHDSLSFLQHQRDPKGHLEFPLECFSPNVGLHDDETLVRISFNLTPRPSLWEKAHRRGSAILRRISSASSTTSGSSSEESKIRNVSSTETLYSDDPTDFKILRRDRTTSTPSTSINSTVSPWAKVMVYLDLEFSSVTHANIFQTAFEKIRVPEFVSRVDFRPIFKDSLVNSPISRINEIAGEEDISPFDLAPRSAPSNSKTAEQTKRISDRAFRVKWIPIETDENGTIEFLRSKLQLDHGSAIYVRSLANSHERNAKVAVVSFENLPSALESISPDQERWSLRKSTNDIDLTVDNHFRALTVLYTPSDSKNHKLDICAVSGLGANAWGSFKARDSAWMWLIDSLSKELPYARIMIYGSDTKLPGNKSIQSLEDLAMACLRALQRSMDGRQRLALRPLIFIAHSLGGLIVRQAMVKAHDNYSKNNNFHHGSFVSGIHGALFFGVPCHGMTTEALEAMVKGQPNRALLDCLRPESQTLRKLGEDFDTAFASEDGPKDIFYFYERKWSPSARQNPTTGQWEMKGPDCMLVSSNSATAGLVSMKRSSITKALNRNHSDLVKFAETDEEYGPVLDILRDMAERAFARDGVKVRE